jgi:glycosyltransferase involved in cell wall biosynthesis
MPNVLLEAKSYNLPIVTTAVSGVAEIISDGEDGLIVPVNDEEKLLTALGEILENPELSEKFRRNSRQKLQKFAFHNVLNQLTELYDKIVTKKLLKFKTDE